VGIASGYSNVCIFIFQSLACISKKNLCSVFVERGGVVNSIFWRLKEASAEQELAELGAGAGMK